MQHQPYTERARLACEIVDLGAALESVLVESLPTFPRSREAEGFEPWAHNVVAARRSLNRMVGLLDQLAAEMPAPASEFENVRRVAMLLDAEADAAPTRRLAACWRSVAAGVREEFSDAAAGIG